MNIEHLVEFAELARQLNFTAAAKTLHITQPALSNHVHALEKETGVVLIERAGKERTRLTPAGQHFLEMAMQILEIYNEMMPQIGKVPQEVEGKILIRSPRNEYSYPLVDYLYEFRKLHPAIDIAMLPWVSTDGIRDVLSGAVDCAYIGHVDPFATVEDDAGTVAFVPYEQTEAFVWVDLSHPLASRHGSLTMQDLDGLHLLIPANEKHDSWLLGMTNICRAHGITCQIDEKYCDSLEDLILSKVAPGDVMLCDANTLKFSAFRLREDRIAVRFSPATYASVSLGYLQENDNPALGLLIAFLHEKYKAVAGMAG